MRNLSLILLLWLGARANLCAASTGTITPAEMGSWEIICGPGAVESEKYAASEFQRLFKGLTGLQLPIKTSAGAEQGLILIGPDAVTAGRTDPELAGLGEEGLRIRLSKTRLCIDGGRPRGTLYGVYEFFEELCGVRFLTHDCTYYPKGGAKRKIALGTWSYQPQFAFRWSYYGENSRFPEFAAQLRVNTVTDEPRLGGRTGYRLVSHNVAYLVAPATYGKEHPEFFALVGGQRKLEMSGGGPQLCMSNPRVIDALEKGVLEEIKKNPAARNINIAQMDNESYCTCPSCAAIDAREESHAGAILAAVNAVAERIEKVHPEVLVSTYAYQYTRKPPKTLRPRHNVLIQLCSIECCDLHPIDDPACPLNREFCHDMNGWNKIAEHIFIWHYNTNFRCYMLPFPNLRSIGRSVAYFAGHHGQGVFMQAAGNGFSTEFSDLRNYVMARCLWKPGRNSWEEMQEFCRLYYQESAGPILNYLKYYHDLVGKAGVHPTCFPTDDALCLNQESVRRILGFFQEALARAQSEGIRARVEKGSLCAYRAALSLSSMRLVYSGGVCRPDLEGLEPGLLNHYEDLCKRFEVSMDDEHISTEQFLSGLRKLYSGLKAICLENDFWRVVVLPESNARIAEMSYKPSGRNIARARRAFNRFRFEEWSRQGEGPSAAEVLPFEVQAQPAQATFVLTTKNGSRLERKIELAGETVRFETAFTAGETRPFSFLVHPEYDTDTLSDDPSLLAIYVKTPEWIHANKNWQHARPSDQQRAVIQRAVNGAAFAYYNHQKKFGVEETFDPADFAELGLFWNPSRQQINLELFSNSRQLERGQKVGYGYEVRYLTHAPN